MSENDNDNTGLPDDGEDSTRTRRIALKSRRRRSPTPSVEDKVQDEFPVQDDPSTNAPPTPTVSPASTPTSSQSIQAEVEPESESVVDVLSQLTSNLEEKWLSEETEQELQEMVCTRCAVEPHVFQGAFSFWLRTSGFISATYLLNEYKKSLGDSASVVSENKFNNCVRLGVRKGLTEQQSTERVNMFLVSHNMKLEKELQQELKDFIQSWTSQHCPDKKYTKTTLEQLQNTLASTFTLLKDKQRERLLQQFLKDNGFSEKKGLFGLGFMGL